MNYEPLFVLIVMIGAIVLFVTEALSVDMVAFVVMITLILGGVITLEEGLDGFASEAMIIIACMFVLSAGLIRTGALDALQKGLFRLAGGSKPRLVTALLLAVAISSAFLNNTPVAVIFLPVVMSISNQLGVAPSRLLIPMSYASILGGTCTLIGTSTNLLVSQVAHEHNMPTIGMFDFSVPGLIFAVVGFLFLATAGRALLPRRASVSAAVSSGKIVEFVTEVMFPADSPLLGKSFQEVLAKTPGITPLMLIRGDEVFMAPLIANPRTQFSRAGDVLLLKGDPGAIHAILERDGITLPPELGELIERQGRGRAVTLVELVVNPNSRLIGRTIRAADFGHRYGGAAVVAVLRREEHLRQRVADIRLRLGDTLLVMCDESIIEHLRGSEEFMLLEGLDERIVRRDKAPIAAAIMALVVGGATLDLLPLSVLALTGVGLMVLTGCLPIRVAYASIDMSIVLLIVGMLALGRAMETSGLAHTVSMGMVDVLRDFGPLVVVAGIYVLTATLTSLISNTAVALLLTPIALDVATEMSYAPQPFLFAVLFGASACFATPMGYQTNLFVYGPGGYRFTDFVRVGLPLNIVLFLTALFVIPWYWPFERIVP